MCDHAAPLNATPQQAPPRGLQTGLSLVEIMVTLSIIAVATSLILLTIPMRPLYKQETGLLREALEQAATRALVTGQPMGLIIEGQRYSPAIWQNGTWRSLKSHSLPDDVTIQVDGKPPEIAEDGEPLMPAVIFDPLGHTKPVAIEISRNGVLTSLTLRPDGRVDVEIH